MIDPFAQALGELVATLESLGIRYAVGGSLASSTHGLLRATEDGDLIAELDLSQLKKLATALGPAWYAEVSQMESALRAGRAFNLIHMGTALKFDVFPASSDFDATQIERAQFIRLKLDGATPCRVTTPEDVLLAKLRWYREGGEVSERQWSDVVGLITSNDTLDTAYLDTWAARLRVADLLAKARSDASL